MEQDFAPVCVAGSNARGLVAVRRVLRIVRFYAPSSHTGERSDAPKRKLALVHEPTMKVLDELKRARGELERLSPARTALAPAIRALRRTELRLERSLRMAV